MRYTGRRDRCSGRSGPCTCTELRCSPRRSSCTEPTRPRSRATRHRWRPGRAHPHRARRPCRRWSGTVPPGWVHGPSGTGAGGRGLVVARRREVPAGEEKVIGAAGQDHLRVVRRRLPGQLRWSTVSSTVGGPNDARPAGVQLSRPDLRRCRGPTTIVGLPEQIGRSGGGIDEGTRVEHPHARCCRK